MTKGEVEGPYIFDGGVQRAAGWNGDLQLTGMLHDMFFMAEGQRAALGDRTAACRRRNTLS